MLASRVFWQKSTAFLQLGGFTCFIDTSTLNTIIAGTEFEDTNYNRNLQLIDIREKL